MATSQNKKFHHFNVFDFLLIVLVVIVITVTAVNFIRSNPNKISGGNKQAIYDITTSALPEALSDQIKQGDFIYDTESGQLLGTVTNVLSSPYSIYGINEQTQESVLTEVDGKIFLKITITSPVWYRDDLYDIDGYRISVGKTMSVRTNNVVVSGECSSLTITEKTN